jgi:pseudouridine-5'-phosphate glycosidase
VAIAVVEDGEVRDLRAYGLANVEWDGPVTVDTPFQTASASKIFAGVLLMRLVEQDIRDEGAVPATIATLKGRLHVGLTDEQIEALAQAKDVKKLSRADLPEALSMGWTGSTTVAATMIAAELAGIKVFATGGIGGVHRGVEETWDVSADLNAFALTDVTVVAAGAKAILDIPKTLEVLETLGVPVIAYGQDDFPAFWSRSSGLKSPLRMDNVEQIAKAAAMRAAMGVSGGQLVANPIPRKAEISREELDPIIERALADAFNRDISGKDVTPFLLQRMYELTEGRSLTANVALIRSNARLAAQIAIANCALAAKLDAQ